MHSDVKNSSVDRTIWRNGWVVAAIVLLLVVADQALKLHIRYHFSLGESQVLLPFFELCFVENNGMAFGIEWLPKWFLTAFRIVMSVLLGIYIHVLLKQGARRPYIYTMALVLAGALGNIVDCVCYGKLFGYAGWFYGRVVDMLYFPLIRNAAGETLFFRPVFNLADSYITVSVFVILIFFSKDMSDSFDRMSWRKK